MPGWCSCLVAPSSSTAGFGGVEVVDDHVEVHLLRHLLARPARRAVVLDRLEADALAVVGADLSPVGGDLDLPVQHRAVERRESAGVGTVDDDAGEACDSHAGTLAATTDSRIPQTAAGQVADSFFFAAAASAAIR